MATMEQKWKSRKVGPGVASRNSRPSDSNSSTSLQMLVASFRLLSASSLVTASFVETNSWKTGARSARREGCHAGMFPWNLP